MKDKLIGFMLLPLFAGAAMAAEPQTVVSIENKDSYLVDSESYISASGYYYKDASGNIHRGPVYNVGEFTIDGIFESKYTASALSLFDADKILGSGELRVASGLYLAPTADMSDFSGKISIFKAHDAQNPAIIFVSRTNNPANASFELAEGARALFTNGDYVLNGKISGAGTLSADKSVDITLADGTEILKNAAPANVVVRGDISEFTGAYSASEGSSIRIESQLVDRVNFSGSTGGILELAGDGAQKKNIEVYSTSNTTTSGSVFMYGNTPIIGQNSNDGGTLDANGGYIYFGGNNEYSATEKISHTFDSTTVLGNTAGNVAIGGSGEGSSMENGADIVVDGVKMYSLTGGGADGASVKGDISLTVKSGEVENLVGGGRGGVHVGNTSITVENGSVSNIYGGDQFGGKVEGDINISVKGGKVGAIYGSNYSSNTPNAEIFNGVTGDVTIDISGGEVNHIRGGINSNNAGDVAAAKQKMVLNGDVVINVGGDAHIGAYDGESILATGGSYASVNGTTTVNISDNAVVDGIIAGGASRTDESGVKSSNINISGGTLNGDVYAGGLKYSSVSGNTAVNISGGEINADVYGGGAVGTSVKGNSTISLTGSTAVINGTLYGGGLDGGTVEGVKTLNLGTSEQAYNGTSALKVADFDKINVSAGSTAQIESITQNLSGSILGTRTSIANGGKLEVKGDVVNNITDATNEGSFVGGLTGGEAVVTGTVKTVIDGENTALHFVYGGNGGNQQTVSGMADPIGTSKVGAVELTVNNGKIDMIVASGAMYSDVDGNVNLNINGGSVTSVYGAASGATIGGDVNISVQNATVSSITAGGCGISHGARPAVVNGSTNIVIGSNAVISNNVYGGGWGEGASWPSVIKGDSNITLVGNATVGGTITGTGWSSEYDIVEGVKTLNLGTSEQAYNGTSALKVADFDKINVSAGSTAQIESITQNLSGSILGTRTSIANGGKLEVKGDVVNNITDATNEGSFVGGLTGGEAVVTGTVKTVIDGENTALHFVYGGNGGNQQTVSGMADPIGTSKVGAVELTVNNGKIDMIVASGAMYSDVDGNVNLNINGGSVTSVYGAASGATIGGDVNISVQNATVSSITAGGCGISHGARPAVVNGSTNIVIGSNAVISNNVYGGGWGDGASYPSVINGNSNITLVDNATVGGTITGTGWNSEYDIVKGVKTLNLGTSEQAYKGTSALKVANFDNINVSAGSSAELFEYAQSDGGTAINIASNSSLSIVLGSAVDQLSKTGVANDGTFSLKRGSLADGASVNLSSYTGTGAVKAYGGILNGKTFTAGKSESFVSSPITVGTGANDVQTVKLGDKLALDFDVAGLGEAALSVNEIKASTDLGGIKGDVLAAFDVDLTDNSNDYTVVFSAYVGSVEDASKLLAWHKDAEGVWTKLDTLIDYADEIASITVDSLGSYAISQVPEPAGIAALLGAVVLAFAAYRRKRG